STGATQGIQDVEPSSSSEASDAAPKAKFGALSILNGILLLLYSFGFLGMLLNPEQNRGPNFMMLLMAMGPISGLMAAMKPQSAKRRKFAKYMNGLMLGLYLFTALGLTAVVLTSPAWNNGRYLTSGIWFGIFFILAVCVISLLNLIIFWKNIPENP